MSDMADQYENMREFFRAAIDMEATIQSKGYRHSAKIVDISAGGLKIESDQVFMVGENVTVEFNVHNMRLRKTCKIVHALLGAATQNIFGCRFEYVNDSDLKKINSYVFELQAASRWKS
jgi:c-di-GMP-binding flagellar brake protein YcgR